MSKSHQQRMESLEGVEFVSLFHRFGVLAFAWDVQEVRHLRAVLRMGIDAVYCDRPDRMVATVSEWVAGDPR